MEEINDKHLAPWAEACAASGVTNTPLSSYIHKELLYNKHLHLSNSKLTAAGFKCSVPEINKQVLIEVVYILIFSALLLLLVCALSTY